MHSCSPFYVPYCAQKKEEFFYGWKENRKAAADVGSGACDGTVPAAAQRTGGGWHIVYGGVTLYTEKRPQRYTFLRSNGENAVTKNVGDTGFYQRLPRDTYVHTSCGTVLAEFIPDYYSASTTTVELSDPTVLKDLSWTISGWNGNDEYKGFPCLTFNFTAAKPGTTTVKLTFYYNYDHGGEFGYCNGCGGWV